MHLALLLVGAHDGSKQHETILEAAAHGPVMLIEPVPHLFARLFRSYGAMRNILCIDCCIAEQSGPVTFHAPRPNASDVLPGADQLGSLRPAHAIEHHTATADLFETITVNAMSFTDLLHRYGITGIDVLITDTEGWDARILPTFPFATTRPNQIVFEYVHADGTFNIGASLGRLLILLDERGYDMRVLDLENCMATRRTTVER